MQALLEAAVKAGEIRAGVDAYENLRAVANLCAPVSEVKPDHGRRMVDLLIDGLRHGAAPRRSRRGQGAP